MVMVFWNSQLLGCIGVDVEFRMSWIHSSGMLNEGGDVDVGGGVAPGRE